MVYGFMGAPQPRGQYGFKADVFVLFVERPGLTAAQLVEAGIYPLPLNDAHSVVIRLAVANDIDLFLHFIGVTSHLRPEGKRIP